jgi:hypothetical protein
MKSQSGERPKRDGRMAQAGPIVLVGLGLIGGTPVEATAFWDSLCLRLNYDGLQNAEPMFDDDPYPLIAQMNDRRLSTETRVESMKRLGELRCRGAVPDLLRLLPPKDRGVLGQHAIVALGEIGDASVLPTLEKLDQDDKIELPGRIRAVLQDVIKVLQVQSGKEKQSMKPARIDLPEREVVDRWLGPVWRCGSRDRIRSGGIEHLRRPSTHTPILGRAE